MSEVIEVAMAEIVPISTVIISSVIVNPPRVRDRFSCASWGLLI
jgi:hypothetical protein